MKKSVRNQWFSISIMAVILILFSSCAQQVPLLLLDYSPPPGPAFYEPRGTINVLRFEDNRPWAEKTGTEFAKEPDGTFIYSKQTAPPLDLYLQRVIKKEFQQTGIFEIDSNGVYELSGTIQSLKITHEEGSGAKLGTCLFAIGILVTPFIVPAIIALALNKNEVATMVVYSVNLKKDGETIWEDNVLVQKKEQYPTGFKGRRRIEDDTSVILINSVTESAREMVRRMDRAI